MKSAAEEIVDFEREAREREREDALEMEIARREHGANEAIQKFTARTHWEPTTEHTPLDSIVAAESDDCAWAENLSTAELKKKLAEHVALSVDLPRDDVIKILGAFREIERAAQGETVNRLFDYFVADGLHPAKMLRRIFSIGAHMHRSPFCDLTLREKKLLLTGSHGAHHWMMKKFCEDPLRRIGAHDFKAPGQKSLASRGRFSRSQQGNQNRKSKTKK